MRYLFYFLAVFSLSTPSLQAQYCHPKDSLELVKFYIAVNGQNSTLNWKLSQPVSSWEWVALTPQGRVKSLWLIGKNLSGELPADLNLPNLTLLGLGNNKIGGTLPKFELLPNLRELELPNNRLTGNIPNYNQPFLQDLELNHNQLTGNIPKFKLPFLIFLSLNHNQLTGEIPAFDTPLLGGLHLEHNQLTGSIPDFQNMPKLQWLVGDFNQLSGNLPSFSQLSSLEWLYLSNNQLTGNIPDFQLPKLKSVRLSHNQFSGNLPKFNLPNLQSLDLRNNQLQGEIPGMILPKMFNLNLSNNQFSGKIPFMDFPVLAFLNLSNNQLNGPIPTMNLPKLNDLDLSNNQLSGHVPDLGAAGLITFMRLNNNWFNFENLEEWIDTNRYTFKIAPQANIPLHVTGKLLWVNAGGTLANNRYYWYRDSVLVAEKAGDSTFIADEPGHYFCRVFNSLLSNPASGDSLVLVSKMYQLTVTAHEIFVPSALRVFPNPVSDNQPLQITLENDFTGTVKFEVLSLDGRVLETFYTEKASEGLTLSRPMTMAPNSFFVKVSDGEKVAIQLVLRY